MLRELFKHPFREKHPALIRIELETYAKYGVHFKMTINTHHSERLEITLHNEIKRPMRDLIQCPDGTCQRSNLIAGADWPTSTHNPSLKLGLNVKIKRWDIRYGFV